VIFEKSKKNTFQKSDPGRIYIKGYNIISLYPKVAKKDISYHFVKQDILGILRVSKFYILYPFLENITNFGEFDQLDPYVARAGFAPASESAGGHTLPF
jgi:hypothetical protein